MGRCSSDELKKGKPGIALLAHPEDAFEGFARTGWKSFKIGPLGGIQRLSHCS